MPCGPKCVCIGEDFDCLAVVAPERYAHFRKWCAGDVPSQRMLVRDMSRMGLDAIDAMNPKTPPPATSEPATPDRQDGPKPVAATPTISLAGDIVASLTAAVGVDRLAKWMAKKATGVPDCGCKLRQEALNRLDLKARRLLKRLQARQNDVDL